MSKIGRYCISVICILFATTTAFAQVEADGSAEAALNREESSADLIESNLKGYYSQVFEINPLLITDLSLYSSMEPWLGTPYRYGGKSFRGIDCSGFVGSVLREALCVELSGGSAEMYRQVEHVTKNELKEGDLVFFRIRRGISHVGIYLGDGKFIHASRSSGVIVSNLESPYYKRYFAKGGRITTAGN